MTVLVGQDSGAPWAIYCEVLTRYVLVLSTLGDCPLASTLEAALDSRDADALAESLRHFAALPTALRSRILDGSPSLDTLLDSLGRDDTAPLPSA